MKNLFVLRHQEESEHDPYEKEDDHLAPADIFVLLKRNYFENICEKFTASSSSYFVMTSEVLMHVGDVIVFSIGFFTRNKLSVFLEENFKLSQTNPFVR